MIDQVSPYTINCLLPETPSFLLASFSSIEKVEIYIEDKLGRTIFLTSYVKDSTRRFEEVNLVTEYQTKNIIVQSVAEAYGKIKILTGEIDQSNSR